MHEPSAFQYRAFISYSHADTSWGKRELDARLGDLGLTP